MIDVIDQKIIQELQKDGRTNFIELAAKLGVAAGTVKNRVAKMIKDDILKIVAIPNVNALGYGFVSFVGFHINLKELRDVTKKLSESQHVCYLVWVTGNYDLMAIVITHSAAELASIVENYFTKIPGVLGMETFVNLDIPKGAWGLLDTAQLVSCASVAPPLRTRRSSPGRKRIGPERG